MDTESAGRILLDTLFRRKRILLAVGLSILGTVLVGTLLWPRSYEASSSVIILGRNYQNPLYSEPGRGNAAAVFIKPEEEINAEIQIVRSRPVLERVVKALQLSVPREVKEGGTLGRIRNTLRSGFRSLSDFLDTLGLSGTAAPSLKDAFEIAVSRLGKNLRVVPQPDSQVIRISYRNRDPVLASQVADRVAQEYLKQHLDINVNRSESAFYADQLKTAEGELAALEEELERVRTRDGIVNFSEQTKLILDKYQTFDVDKATIRKKIIAQRSIVERIRALRTSRPDALIPLPEIARDPQIQDLENKLINLRYQFQNLRLRYTDSSRQVIAAGEQLKNLQRQIRDQVGRYLEREVAQERVLEAEEHALDQTLLGVKGEIDGLPSKERVLSVLQKRIEDKQAVLTTLRKRYQDALVAQGTDYRVEEAKIVSLSSVPLDPVVPNVPLDLALGLILAVVVSFSSAFFVDYWDDSLKVPEDVERHLKRTVFASVPEL